MRIAIFSDVHGNYINLLSFFESTKGMNIDKYICLGDLCNYYPDNEKVINLINSKNIICLLGNHDELYISDKLLSDEKKAKYCFDEKLKKADYIKSFFKKLPQSLEINENGKSIFFCHASPIDLLNTYVYPDTDLNIYNNVPYDYIFMGHTHRQFLTEHHNKVFCNVGSIGLPRDNGSLMGFAVIDTNNFEIKLFRKMIDYRAVIVAYEKQAPADVIKLLDRKESINFNYTLI